MSATASTIAGESAARLARAPARPKASPPPNQQWRRMRSHLEARLAMLRNWRYSWMEHYQLLEAYILPRRGAFINPTMPTPNTMIRGEVINQNIIDPTGTQAMRICAAGLMSGLMSPGRPWFKLKPALFPREQIDADGGAWFEEVEDRMYQVMARSNFYDAGAQMFEDLTVFGTATEIIYEDERDIIRCYLSCPGEYFLASGPDGRINGVYRMFVWTVAQMVQFFELENCPRDIQELWRTKGSSLDVERIVAHALEPNFGIADGDETGVVPGGFAWRECYWVWGNACDWPLSMGGFNEPPHVVPRWATTSNDPYGRSAGMDVLQDIMQLQEETKRKAEAIQKMVRPPMLASVELKNEPSSTIPGGITFVSQLGPEKGMRPVYTVNPEIREMMEDLKEIQQRIRVGFFNDLFLMIAESRKDMTAYEVAQRQQEKLQVLGPITERWQNEYASPAIKRVFRIMERKRLLPPLPQSLQGVPLGIEYVSLLAMAQKVSATAGLERYAQVVGSLTAIYPEARAKLRPGEFLDEYAGLLGVSRKVVGTDEDMAALVQMMQKQQEAAAAMQVTQAGVAGAKTLSETELGGGQNALAMLMGRGGTANAA